MKDSQRFSRYLILSLPLAIWVLGSACATAPVASKKENSASNPPVIEVTDNSQSEQSKVSVSDLPEGDFIEAEPEFSSLPKESAEAVREIEKEILEADAELKAEAAASHAKIPIEINRNVRKWIHYFTVQDRERFQRFLDRGNEFKTQIKEILQQNGVPTELYYLGMIESGYVLSARSHASAVGPWQFMPGTAERYGLMQNRYVDERRDILRSTEAAAKYLRSIYTAFQSWYLTIAAYNAGEGRILGAIIRGGTRNFWELAEKKGLPRETQDYVPKFLAAAIIGKHPKKFGFKVSEPPRPMALELAQVPGSIRLADIAKTLNLPSSTLKDLNPQVLKDVTPPQYSMYSLWVPKGKAEIARAKFQQMAQMKVRVVERAIAQSSGRYHRVKRGENLETIARRYGLSVSELRKINKIRGTQVNSGSKLRVTKSSTSSYILHRVKAGEALTAIAQKYGVSVSHIRNANDLKSPRIYVGQRLRIHRDI